MKRIIFILLIILAFIVRTYRIADIPPALSWDEVSIGYNAYSILKTGRDEHGRFLPVDAFIAYGDYKPPLAIYLTVPSIAILGLNELGVRFPSALFGTLTVFLTYFLVKELFKRSHQSSILSFFTSFLLTISPWHINISRAGFEANIALFFVVLGTWMILVSREKPRIWIIAGIPYVLSMYTFNSSRYFVVVFSLGLLFYCWKEIKREWKRVVAGFIIAMFVLLPLIPHLASKEARLRFMEVNIFSDINVIKKANEQISLDNYSFFAKVVHNRRMGFLRNFFLHYFDHFSPDFLFIRGDGNPKFSTQDLGQLYIIELPFLLIGIYYVFLIYRKTALFLIYWLFTAIIPAAVARETPHALRILNSFPVWHIFIGIGVLTVTNHVIRTHKYTILIAICFLYIFNIVYYFRSYYIHYPRMYSNEWQYGYKQVMEYIDRYGKDYKKIYISDSIGRPYMYALFYLQYDPKNYQPEKKSFFDASGFYHVSGFNKYIFTNAPPFQLDSDSLYIFQPGQKPEGVTIKKTIPLLNGVPVLTIF